MNPWTKQELGTLSDALAAGGSDSDLARQLSGAVIQRSVPAIINKLQRMRGGGNKERFQSPHFPPPILRLCFGCREVRPMDKNHRYCSDCKKGWD